MSDIIILATAGLRPGQTDDVDHKCFPRVDYLELSRYLDVKIINYDSYDRTSFGHFLRYSETQLRSDLYLALLGTLARSNASVVFAMSERAGLPFAMAQKFSSKNFQFLSMFQSWSWRQELAISSFNLLHQMDTIAVHCKSMAQKLSELSANPEKINIVPYSTDEKFFLPEQGIDQQSDLIFSLGEPRSRNYPLLFEAVSSLPVKLVAATSGMWYAREKQRHVKVPIPENVETVRNLPLRDLRKIYTQCSFVVLPVHHQIASAGATGVLEAACMERAVIVTHSPGLDDFVVDGETGIFVEPNNINALRDAIQNLLSHPEEARRLGINARQRVEERYNFDNYVRTLAQLITKSVA